MMKINNYTQFKKLPDAFLFDMDNTFYAYEPPHLAAQKAVCDKAMATFSISKKDFDKALEEAKQQIKLRLKQRASSHSRLLYFQRMLEIIGLGSQVLMALDFEQTYWRTFLNEAILFNEVKELLDDIRLLGLPMAIVTDLTAQIQFRKMIYFGLDKYFDYIVTSEEAGFDKPHESPFLLALAKIAPRGNCVWMIGDNAVNDIAGAREKINAITLQKLHNGVEPGKGTSAPDAFFYEFAEVRNLLTKLVSE